MRRGVDGRACQVRRGVNGTMTGVFNRECIYWKNECVVFSWRRDGDRGGGGVVAKAAMEA